MQRSYAFVCQEGVRDQVSGSLNLSLTQRPESIAARAPDLHRRPEAHGGLWSKSESSATMSRVSRLAAEASGHLRHQDLRACPNWPDLSRPKTNPVRVQNR